MTNLTVVIPVLSDSDALIRLMADIPADSAVELIVVDGGADPHLPARLGPRAHVIECTPGRGVQMNAGAARASGHLLLFLHADSRLPPGWETALHALPPDSVGGWFQFALDDDAWQARVLERLVAWRVRLFRLPYGDQGIFVRTDAFRRLGGFKAWPLMEDVDFARRLAAAGPVTPIPLPLMTASRRWRRDGWVRRSVMNLVLISLYFIGVSPHRLAGWYGPPTGPS